MPTVPGYEPVPQVSPFERPVPLPEPSIPQTAFGTGIAEATRAFGGDVDKLATQVGDRALAFREMQIETSVRDKTTDFMNQATALQEKYLALQGQDAVNQSRQHLAALEQLRQAARQGVGQYGIYGQKLFDDQASSLQRSYTREVAQHSARQLQVSTDHSIDSEIGALQEQLGREKDPANIKDLTDKITAAETRRGHVWGDTQATIDYKANNAVSVGVRKNTQSQMENDPLNATTIADRAENDNPNLNQQDKDELRKRAQNIAATTGPHAWFDGLRTGVNISLGERKIDPDRLAQAIIYNNEGGLIRGTKFKDPKTGEERQALDGGIMPESLPRYLKEAGLPSMTPEEYQAKSDQWKYNFIKGILTRAQDRTPNSTANDAAVEYFTGQPLTPETVGRRDPFHNTVWYLRTFNQALASKASPKEIGDAARDYGDTVKTGGVPDAGELYRVAVTDRQDRDISRQAYQRHFVDDQVTRVMTTGNPDTGKPYQDWNEFSADPRNQELIQTGRSVDAQFDANMSRRLSAFSKAFEVQTDREHRKDLVEQMLDPTQRQQFMEQDFWADKKLSQKDQIYFSQQKAKMFREGTLDPNVNRAYDFLMESHPNEVPNKANDPQGYKDYKERLFDAIQGWEEREKQPLKLGTPEANKVLGEIHEMLVHRGPAGFIFPGTKAYEEQPVITDEYARDVRSINENATDDDIRYLFLKEQSMKYFDRLYGTQQKRALPDILAPTVSGKRVATTSQPQPVIIRPRFGAQPPAKVDIIQPLVKAAGLPGVLPAEVPVTEAQETAIKSAVEHPFQPAPEGVRTRLLREQHVAPPPAPPPPPNVEAKNE
jgi:hypothetical protein